MRGIRKYGICTKQDSIQSQGKQNISLCNSLYGIKRDQDKQSKQGVRQP